MIVFTLEHHKLDVVTVDLVFTFVTCQRKKENFHVIQCTIHNVTSNDLFILLVSGLNPISYFFNFLPTPTESVTVNHTTIFDNLMIFLEFLKNSSPCYIVIICSRRRTYYKAAYRNEIEVGLGSLSQVVSWLTFKQKDLSNPDIVPVFLLA